MTDKEYNECVRNYADNVYRFILKNLRHQANAEDVVQSSFETLWQKRADVNFETSKSFLFTIAYRRMIDLVRKEKKTEVKESMEPFEKSVYTIDNDVKKVLNIALNQLSEIKKSVILLKDYEGYSYEEIGKITGLNLSQVKVYIHRARLQLRDYLVKIDNII